MKHLVELKDMLQANQDVNDTLETLNAILETSPSNTEILQVASIINPQLLFLYLSPSTMVESTDTLDMACLVLYKMLQAFPFPELKRMAQQIELGMQHSHIGVRHLCVKLLYHKITHSNIFHTLVLHPTMFHLVTQLVGDQSLECSQTACNIITTLLKDESCRVTILGSLGEGFLLDLQGLMVAMDTVKFRVYDLVVQLCGLGEDVFLFVQAVGFIDRLIGEMESNDVLLKLNCLELLQTLIESPHGLGVVNSADILKKLHNLLSTQNNDPFAIVLKPGKKTI